MNASDDKKQNFLGKIEEKADELLNLAGSSIYVQAGIKYLPGGGFLEGKLFERIRKERTTRIQDFIDMLKQRIDKIDEILINKDYLQSDEFILDMERAYSNVIEFQIKYKIKMLANIAINRATDLKYLPTSDQKQINDSQAIGFHKALVEIDQIHIDFLQLLFGNPMTEAKSISKALSPKYSSNELFTAMTFLSSKALIGSEEGAILMESDFNNCLEMKLFLTDLGKLFMLYCQSEP